MLQQSHEVAFSLRTPSTARNARNVPSTAVDRDRTCTNAGDGPKNLTLKVCATAVDGVLNARFLRPSPRSHTFDRGQPPSMAPNGCNM